MTIPTTDSWDPTNLSHKFLTSFFMREYKDKPSFVAASNDRKNKDLTYFNIADHDNSVEAQICASLCIAYMENQGLPYHAGRTRKDCYEMLVGHLSDVEGKVLYTADIVDFFYKFAGEF